MIRILQYEKFKQLSEAQQRDFNFYLQQEIKCKWIDYNIGLQFFSPVEKEKIYPYFVSVEHWYWLYDTYGICALCENWHKCLRLMSGKINVNLTIKMWYESIIEESLFIHEIWNYCHTMPAWTWKSFKHQLNKTHPIRFSFQRIDELFGIYIEYCNLWFDPSI